MRQFVINDLYGVSFKYNYLNKVLKIALKKEKVENACFSIIFVGEKEIQDINKTYRGIDKATDVISFALEDNGIIENQKMRMLGDIYVCIPRALEQAEAYGHSIKRELSFLCIHGLLHLLGYDHMKKEEEEVMFKRQELVLNEAGITR